MSHRTASRRTLVRVATVVACVWVGAAALPQAAVRAATVTYRVVTNEIAAKQADGSEKEVYRFDPAVYVANEGDDVELHLYGLRGHDHPFVLEGYNVRGVIHRNQETVVRVHADRPGYFRLVCTSHADAAHEGPMEAYLIVIPRQR
ncbi:transcriptional regulator [Alicyclobacillus sp.]|uniref:transcriptional regulator n=1 Tax=Alicyclobacillus sp. TaxID=61169 RepID=UPI0025BE72F2|nr:transcriptional regulator [Alicyclobacillus sp.]MCL6516315.1 transcriptional regulator [Alicyclobacillus sp.]